MTEIRPDRQGRPDRVAAEMLAQGRALRRRHNLIDAGRTTPSAHRVDRVTQSKLITCTHKIVQARNNNNIWNIYTCIIEFKQGKKEKITGAELNGREGVIASIL